MKHISSIDNPQIKIIASLATKKGRAAHNLCFAEGIRCITTLCAAKWKPSVVACLEGHLREAQQLVDDAAILVVTDAVMQKISDQTTPPGLLAVFPLPATPTAPLQPGLVLAKISDPGNMGTLIRSAAAFGKKTVVIVEGCDPFSPKVLQASAGTVAHMAIYRLPWTTLLTMKKNIPLCALVVDNSQIQAPSKESLIVIGNEAEGIPADWRADCITQCTIPMPGGTESLNAAVAGSIALFWSTL